METSELSLHKIMCKYCGTVHESCPHLREDIVLGILPGTKGSAIYRKRVVVNDWILENKVKLANTLYKDLQIDFFDEEGHVIMDKIDMLIHLINQGGNRP